jgi:hypothetical protein
VADREQEKWRTEPGSSNISLRHRLLHPAQAIGGGGYFTVAGHFARSDVFRMRVNESPAPAEW